MKYIQWKKWMPHLGAVLIFLVIAIAYMYPVLEGKVLNQNDIIQHKRMSKEIVDFREETGQEALWTNSMFSGMPAYQISVLYKANLVKYIDKIISLGLPRLIALIFLYMIGFYILLQTLRINPWLSIFGAIVFAFSSYFFIILEAGHNSKAHAIAYMAPVVAGIMLTYKGRYLLGGIISMLFLALEIRAGHPQITYYLMILTLIFVVFELLGAVREKQIQRFIKASVIILFASLLAVGTHTSNLWGTYEYGKYTIRGESELKKVETKNTGGLDRDYVTHWSYGISETLSLLIPNIHGGASLSDLGENSASFQELVNQGVAKNQARTMVKEMPVYWGDQPFTAGPVYAGSIVMFLFVMGLFLLKGRFKWWLIIATILSVLLAWGKNFMFLTDLFLDYFPLYNKFRAVTMTLVIAELSIPLLAIVTLDKIFKGSYEKNRILKAGKYAFYITGGISLVLFVLPGVFFDFSGTSDGYVPDWLWEPLHDDRKRLLSMDALRSLIFISLAAISLYFFVQGKLKKNYLFAALIVLGLVDMWTVNKRYLNNDKFISERSFDKFFQPSRADKQILKDNDLYYRVANLTTGDIFSDAATSYFHKSVGGYHAAKMRRYQEMFRGENQAVILDMMNTKYVIQMAEDKKPFAIQNPNAMGNAWFVNRFIVVNNADEELEAFDGFDLQQEAILNRSYNPGVEEFKFNHDNNASVKLTHYAPNALKYDFKSGSDEVVVFSDIHYDKGWKAFVDGEEKPYFRVNYVLRSMIVPKGAHTIEWKFEPKAYYVGEKISLASSILLIFLVLGGAMIELKNHLRKE